MMPAGFHFTLSCRACIQLNLQSGRSCGGAREDGGLGRSGFFRDLRVKSRLFFNNLTRKSTIPKDPWAFSRC